ncbi:MAG: hypothetical protein JRE40_04190 [Deltaproteobacteria bacterium]|nr:hypothetical protein [Deltaproteobacteria bacterium]
MSDNKHKPTLMEMFLTQDPRDMAAHIETLDKIISERNAEIERLREACSALLDGVNARHPDKARNEWTCPDMARIAALINYAELKGSENVQAKD